jgi:hypothetical protein
VCCGWWKKSRLICYVFKARTQEILNQQRRDMCALLRRWGVSAGQGEGKMSRYRREKEMTES